MQNEKELKDKLLSHLTVRTGNNHNIENVLKEICLYSGWPYGEGWRYDRENKNMKFFTAWYTDANFTSYEKFSSLCKFSPGVGLVGKTLQNKEPVWIENLLEDLSFVRSDVARHSGIISGFAVPLFNEQDLYGIFAFFLTKKQHLDELNRKIVNNLLAELSFVF